MTYRQPALLSLTGLPRLRLPAMAGIGADALGELVGRGGWRACEPVEDPSAAVRSSCAVRRDDDGRVLQTYVDLHNQTIVIADLSLDQADPWSLAAFWRIERRELFFVQADWHGRTTTHHGGFDVAGPGRQIDPRLVADALL